MTTIILKGQYHRDFYNAHGEFKIKRGFKKAKK